MLDWDNETGLASNLQLNPRLADSFQRRGANGAQIALYCNGKRPKKVCAIKVPISSPLAIGAKKEPNKNGLVQIGEFRAEGGQSVLVGEHPDSSKENPIWFNWPIDNPPIDFNFEDIVWHPDIVISGWNDSDKNGNQEKERENGTTPREGGRKKEEGESILKKARKIVTIDDLWKHFGFPNRKGKNLVSSPFRKGDDRPSFSVFIGEDGVQRFKDHGDNGDTEGDSFDFYQLVTDLDWHSAFKAFVELAGIDIATGAQKTEVKEEFLEKETREAQEWYNRKTIDVPKPIAEEAFIGFPGRWVRAIEKQTECNSDNLLAQLMVALGTIFGRYFYNYCVQNLFTNEFLTVLGDSGIARKGSALEKVKEFLRLIDPGWAKRGIKGGFPSGEAIIHFLRDPTFGRDKKGSETIRDPGNPDKRLLMVAPEFARLLKFAERKGNILTEILREAWDSPEELSNQAKNGSDYASYPHLGLISHVTEKELRKFDPELISNGFLNRMIFVLAFQAREIPNPKPIEWPPELLEEFKEIYRLAHVPAELDISQLGAAPEPQIKHIPLTEEAESLWEKIYYEHSNNKDEKLNEILRRFNDHIRVLALIYALCDRSPVITVLHLLAAKAIMDHSRACAVSIFSTFSSNKAANKILEALKRQFPEALTKTEIYNEVFNRHLPTSEINEALAFLFQNNLATVKVCTPTPSVKKPTQKWFAVSVTTATLNRM
jgi:hypothetical protein